MFVQLAHFVKDYHSVVKPMVRLTGKVPWKQFVPGSPELAAFERAKRLILEQPRLSSPDASRQLFLEVDASDEGHSYTLYHKRVEVDADGEAIRR